MRSEGKGLEILLLRVAYAERRQEVSNQGPAQGMAIPPLKYTQSPIYYSTVNLLCATVPPTARVQPSSVAVINSATLAGTVHTHTLGTGVVCSRVCVGSTVQ